MSIEVSLQGRVGAGDALLDHDLRDLQILSVGAGKFLYAGTGQNGGLTAWRLYDDGRMVTLSDSAYFIVSGIETGPLSLINMQGSDQLVLGGVGSGRLVCYDLDTPGQIGSLGLIDLPGSSGADYSSVVSARLSEDTQVYYMLNSDTGALEAYSEAPQGGGLQGDLGQGGAPEAYTLGSQSLLLVATVADTDFLLAADNLAHGVTSYQINGVNGGLNVRDSIGAPDGLGVTQPTAMASVTAFGKTWVILAAATSNSLSVMQLHETGRLSATDHVLDTLATRFGQVQAMAVAQKGDRVFILVGGGDDGLSLFTLLPDGRLVHLQALANDSAGGADLGLHNVSAIEATLMGDTIQIFTTSGSNGGQSGGQAGGLSQFTLDLAGLGGIFDNTGGDETILNGGAGDDLIIGGNAQDEINGGGGGDILVSGRGGGLFTGGDGADLFVLSPVLEPYNGVALRITDFERGVDSLDLSAFGMLRGPDQLTLHSTPVGARLIYGADVIVIASRDGNTLYAYDLWGLGFATPDRVLVLNPAAAGAVYGTVGKDLLIGDAGRDQFYGDAGHDLLRGAAGRDKLYGQGGRDRVYGGDGADVLRGGGANDQLFGNAGKDRLYGAAGQDKLKGGRGADSIHGGDGDDILKGNEGLDVLQGGRQNDWLLGGRGADTLSGGQGRDILLGGAGNDVLDGGKGNDILTGGGGMDHFVFVGGHDVITDFTSGMDDIRLLLDPGNGIAGFGDLRLQAMGHDTVIDTGQGVITLTDVTPGALSADDFLFV